MSSPKFDTVLVPLFRRLERARADELRVTAIQSALAKRGNASGIVALLEQRKARLALCQAKCCAIQTTLDKISREISAV